MRLSDAIAETIREVREKAPNEEWIFVCSPRDVEMYEPILKRLYIKTFPWAFAREDDAWLVTREWLEKNQLKEWRLPPAQ